jgi:hypothetical protein
MVLCSTWKLLGFSSSPEIFGVVLTAAAGAASTAKAASEITSLRILIPCRWWSDHDRSAPRRVPQGLNPSLLMDLTR